jgi:hypothetical protein
MRNTIIVATACLVLAAGVGGWVSGRHRRPTASGTKPPATLPGMFLFFSYGLRLVGSIVVSVLLTLLSCGRPNDDGRCCSVLSPTGFPAQASGVWARTGKLQNARLSGHRMNTHQLFGQLRLGKGLGKPGKSRRTPGVSAKPVAMRTGSFGHSALIAVESCKPVM